MSIRWSPQPAWTMPLVMTSPTISSVRGSAGSALTVIARYEPLLANLHSALIKPGTLTYGVVIGLGGLTQSGVGADESTMPDAVRYECNSALPPASAAGLVQDDTRLGSVDFANKAMS